MKKNTFTEIDTQLLETLHYQLENGIIVNDEKIRDFGILDYYYLFQDSPLEMIKNDEILVSEEEKNKLRQLYTEYVATSVMKKNTKIKLNVRKTPKALMKEDRKFFDLDHCAYKLNEYGKKVLDMEKSTILIPTAADKHEAIEFMEMYHIPMTEKLFSLALLSYMKQELPYQLEEEHVLKKAIR